MTLPRHYSEGQLRAYLDNETEPDERLSLQSHLATCAACAGMLAELQALASQAWALLMEAGAPLPDARAALARFRAAQVEALALVRVRETVVFPAGASTSQGPSGRRSVAPLPAARRAGQFAFTGLGLGLVMVLLLAVSALIAGNMAGNQSGVSELEKRFVPQGKVRHLVISDTFTANWDVGISPARQWDLWYTLGAGHLLMHQTIRGLGGNLENERMTVWVEEDAVYALSEGYTSPRTVYMYPYNPGWLGIFGPNDDAVSRALQVPNSHVVGNTTVNAVPVVEIATIADRAAATPQATQGGLTAPEMPVVDKYVWIQPESGRAMHVEYVHYYYSGISAGHVETNTNSLVLDEIRDISEYPTDFFKFSLPDGAKLVTGAPDPMQPTPAPPARTAIPESLSLPPASTIRQGTNWPSRAGSRKNGGEQFAPD